MRNSQDVDLCVTGRIAFVRVHHGSGGDVDRTLTITRPDGHTHATVPPDVLTEHDEIDADRERRQPAA